MYCWRSISFPRVNDSRIIREGRYGRGATGVILKKQRGYQLDGRDQVSHRYLIEESPSSTGHIAR